MMGVSGGGGEPLCAFVVDVDAVELRRLMPLGLGIFSAGSGDLGPGGTWGGGQYCWW